MAPRGRDHRPGLTAEEFNERFQAGARVLWTLAAGLLGDPAEAEDLCQEAFLAAHDKRDQFDAGTDFLAWMGRFVRNLAANELRKRARRRTASADPAVLDAGHAFTGSAARPGELLDHGPADDEHALDPEELEERLLAGLRELGDVPRACLLLRALRELSYAEIAGLLGIPEGTAMSHVSRARTTLRASATNAQIASVFRRADWLYPIPYFCTAIIRGKWEPYAIEVCASLGVTVDTSRRKLRIAWDRAREHALSGAVRRRVRRALSMLGLTKP